MDRAQKEGRDRDAERLARLRPIDDDFMRCLFAGDVALAQDVLRTLTGIDDLTMVKMETQHDIKRLAGARSACLDVWGVDGAGTWYDLEVQRGERPQPRRARYYSAAMDVDALDEGQPFEGLPEQYVIFVMEHDPFGGGLGLYSFGRVCGETGQPLNDGTHVLYANGAYRGNDDLGLLMHDLCESDPAKMHNALLSGRASYLKKDPRGVSEMCEVFEEIREEGLEKGRREGLEKGRREGREIERAAGIASLMERLGFGAREAMEALGIPPSDYGRYLAMLQGGIRDV